MPPKRKLNPPPPSKAVPTPSTDAADLSSEPDQTPLNVEDAKSPVLLDLWTDEQETSLFKAMIRWKPVGMHKHFRMIAISQHLRNHGYTSAQDDHTRIPHIWEKLGKLYNLKSLDEREDFVGESRLDDKDIREEPFCQFKLPEDTFGELMFAKRLKPEGSFSPPLLPNRLSVDSGAPVRRQSTIEDTDETRSSPASARGHHSKRGPRGARKSQLQEVSLLKPTNRKSKANTGDGSDDDHEDEKQNNAGGDGDKEVAESISQAALETATSKTRRKSSRRK